ncbi:MAG: hypothetical protein M1823_005591 [Watsoniomyces obsoletus]|nr:MAG: hypothetical protein M1823_005591 [Watsoniomyces obsoletus]
MKPSDTDDERERPVNDDDIRPFPCPEVGCSKRFNRKSDLLRHHRIHTNERPYICDVHTCGKSFIQRSALTVHARTHTGEKPHRCEYVGCGKCFSDSSSLARHRRIHTGKRPYKCAADGCDKSFCRKTTLTKHQFRAHQMATETEYSESETDTDDDGVRMLHRNTPRSTDVRPSPLATPAYQMRIKLESPTSVSENGPIQYGPHELAALSHGPEPQDQYTALPSYMMPPSLDSRPRTPTLYMHPHDHNLVPQGPTSVEDIDRALQGDGASYFLPPDVSGLRRSATTPVLQSPLETPRRSVTYPGCATYDLSQPGYGVHPDAILEDSAPMAELEYIQGVVPEHYHSVLPPTGHAEEQKPTDMSLSTTPIPATLQLHSVPSTQSIIPLEVEPVQEPMLVPQPTIHQSPFYPVHAYTGYSLGIPFDDWADKEAAEAAGYPLPRHRSWI